VRNALKALPAGSEAYSHAYHDAMQRIEGQVSDHAELAKEVLSWITCAKRPFTAIELQHALAVEADIDSAELDEENLPLIEVMVSVCAGLVVIDEESGIMRLVHYTTQEYFERTQKQWFPTAEADIAKVCLTYLSFEVFGSGFCFPYFRFQERLRLNLLYSYASSYWGEHARLALESMSISRPTFLLALDNRIAMFLECEAKVEAAAQAMLIPTRFNYDYEYHFDRVPGISKHMTGLHLAAYFGLIDSTKLMLRGADVEVKDCYLRTPLLWAASEGHDPVVKQLLDTKANVESTDDLGQTSLSHAAQRGHQEIVRLLLEVKPEVNIESMDYFSQTPLLLAVENGHEAVVRQLLKVKAKIESKANGQTSLSLASEKGHLAIVKHLLDARANVESKNARGWTPLSYAARNGYEAVIRQLLDAKADIESKDAAGWTPLSHAAMNGHEAVIRQLLDAKADIESKDKYGSSLLSRAVREEDSVSVKFLLAIDAVNPDSRDNTGRTPLSYAASVGNKAIVTTLLANDRVFPHSRDHFGSTPLSIAVRHCHEEVVKLLLSTPRINLNLSDNFGRTPLWWARRQRNADIAQLLLNNAERAGISLCEDKAPVAAGVEHVNSISCDVCTLGMPKNENYYHCRVCNGGDFDVCLECYNIGGRCLQEGHVLSIKSRVLI
jgi:ankyrin repeat protein